MNLLSELAKNISPYIPGEQINDDEYIKLNTNENPYSPSNKVIEALKEYDMKNLRLYPDADSIELRKILSINYKVNMDEIFVGNGSDELLALSFLSFFNVDDVILFPDITYSFYEVYSDLFKIKYKKIPVNNDFSIDLDKYNVYSKGIIIANPNAPTGIYLERNKIIKLIKANREKLFIIDEAYIDFGGESCIDFIKEYDNLLIIRTLSKSHSLAGMRIGIAFGNSNLIAGINKIKNCFNSYTVNRLSMQAAISSYLDKEYFKLSLNKLINTRERVRNILINLNFEVTKSYTNFLFIRHKYKKAEYICSKLKEKKILVRYFNKDRIDNHLRVSIGTDSDMDIMLNELSKIL